MQGTYCKAILSSLFILAVIDVELAKTATIFLAWSTYRHSSIFHHNYMWLDWGPAFLGYDLGCFSFLLKLYSSLRLECFFFVIFAFFSSSFFLFFFFSILAFFGQLGLFRFFNLLFSLGVGLFLTLTLGGHIEIVSLIRLIVVGFFY